MGKILQILGVPFRFVTPTQTARGDYDLEIYFPSGIRAFGDTKCKLESTTVSKSSVKNSLDKARTQLPQGLPGIIFLKLPHTWWSDEGRTSVKSAVEDFFRITKRVISVKTYFTLTEVRGENTVQEITGLEYRNVHPELAHYGDVNIFEHPHPGKSVGPNWMELKTV